MNFSDREFCGRHIILDIYTIEKEHYNIVKLMDKFEGFLMEFGHNILHRRFHCFGMNDTAWTFFFLLAESHLAGHSYPERGIITLDFYTCKINKDTSVFVSFVHKLFEGQKYYATHLLRGANTV